ncbi:DNA-binding response regulator [Polymorphobacter glacialis]|uniref:DNA-binding response regulator n=1 Tax=Sandarakinorhabdus glacialis TaxID=1614636 RepID=A0A917E8Z5_9SPHN|nr:response regulator transcription factor [Polymorphobacter glacialis]GGE15780.1 DNA-binding response regulator [Polymorphobacter glacialis]
MIRQRVLIVDDDLHIRRLLGTTLARAGYDVIEAANARDALDLARAETPDVILLDLGLPDRNGLEILPLLKKSGKAPVLVVSAREATDDKVAALDLGADDYVTKPFDTEELLARVRAALRHAINAQGADEIIVAGSLRIDLGTRRIHAGDQEVHLTRKEYDVLAQLAMAPGRVVTHQTILKAAWPAGYEQHIEYLRIVVRNLRQKIEPDPSRPTLIVNELGVGYRLTV